MNPLYGEIAAIGTSLCWAVTSTFFTISGKKIGSVNVNRIRLAVALVFLSLTHLVLQGELFPLSASPQRWFWLGSSGIIGFAIGDAMLFEAFVVVGARVSMLLLSLVPIMGAVLAWVTLGETLSHLEVFAILLTVGGIVWVVADKHRDDTWVKGRKLAAGIALAMGGALCQTIGLVLSKKGLEGDFPELSGNLIRVICAVVVLWALTVIAGKAKKTILSLADGKALAAVMSGSFFGPFLGVWLSLIAINNAKIGIASTLMSLAPIVLIPISRWVFNEKITWHAVLGTVVAIIGVAILFLVRQV